MKTKNEIDKIKEEIREIKFRLDNPMKFDIGKTDTYINIVSRKVVPVYKPFRIGISGNLLTLPTPPPPTLENRYVCYDTNNNNIVELSEGELSRILEK